MAPTNAKVKPSPQQLVRADSSRCAVTRLLPLPAANAFLAACVDHTIRLYPVEGAKGGKPLAALRGPHESAVRDIALLDEQLLVSVASDGTVCTWRLHVSSNAKRPPTLSLVHSLTKSRFALSTAAAAAANSIVVGSDEGHLFLISHVNGARLENHSILDHAHRGRVNALAVFDDLVLSGGDDSIAAIWDTADLAQHGEFHLSAPITAVVVDAHHIAATCADGSLHLFDSASFDSLWVLRDLDFVLNSARFFDDSTLLLSCLTGRILFVSLDERAVVARVEVPDATYLLDAVAVDATRIAVGGMPGLCATFAAPDIFTYGVPKPKPQVANSSAESLDDIPRATTRSQRAAKDSRYSANASASSLDDEPRSATRSRRAEKQDVQVRFDSAPDSFVDDEPRRGKRSHRSDKTSTLARRNSASASASSLDDDSRSAVRSRRTARSGAQTRHEAPAASDSSLDVPVARRRSSYQAQAQTRYVNSPSVSASSFDDLRRFSDASLDDVSQNVRSQRVGKPRDDQGSTGLPSRSPTMESLRETEPMSWAAPPSPKQDASSRRRSATRLSSDDAADAQRKGSGARRAPLEDVLPHAEKRLSVEDVFGSTGSTPRTSFDMGTPPPKARKPRAAARRSPAGTPTLASAARRSSLESAMLSPQSLMAPARTLSEAIEHRTRSPPPNADEASAKLGRRPKIYPSNGRHAALIGDDGAEADAQRCKYKSRGVKRSTGDVQSAEAHCESPNSPETRTMHRETSSADIEPAAPYPAPSSEPLAKAPSAHHAAKPPLPFSPKPLAASPPPTLPKADVAPPEVTGGKPWEFVAADDAADETESQPSTIDSARRVLPATTSLRDAALARDMESAASAPSVKQAAAMWGQKADDDVSPSKSVEVRQRADDAQHVQAGAREQRDEAGEKVEKKRSIVQQQRLSLEQRVQNEDGAAAAGINGRSRTPKVVTNRYSRKASELSEDAGDEFVDAAESFSDFRFEDAAPAPKQHNVVLRGALVEDPASPKEDVEMADISADGSMPPISLMPRAERLEAAVPPPLPVVVDDAAPVRSRNAWVSNLKKPMGWKAGGDPVRSRSTMHALGHGRGKAPDAAANPDPVRSHSTMQDRARTAGADKASRLALSAMAAPADPVRSRSTMHQRVAAGAGADTGGGGLARAKSTRTGVGVGSGRKKGRKAKAAQATQLVRTWSRRAGKRAPSDEPKAAPPSTSAPAPPVAEEKVSVANRRSMFDRLTKPGAQLPPTQRS